MSKYLSFIFIFYNLNGEGKLRTIWTSRMSKWPCGLMSSLSMSTAFLLRQPCGALQKRKRSAQSQSRVVVSVRCGSRRCRCCRGRCRRPWAVPCSSRSLCPSAGTTAATSVGSGPCRPASAGTRSTRPAPAATMYIHQPTMVSCVSCRKAYGVALERRIVLGGGLGGGNRRGRGCRGSRCVRGSLFVDFRRFRFLEADRIDRLRGAGGLGGLLALLLLPFLLLFSFSFLFLGCLPLPSRRCRRRVLLPGLPVALLLFLGLFSLLFLLLALGLAALLPLPLFFIVSLLLFVVRSRLLCRTTRT